MFSAHGVGALKSCDAYSRSTEIVLFSVHGPGDFLKFILLLRKILSLRREDVFAGREVGALKSCDTYSQST